MHGRRSDEKLVDYSLEMIAFSVLLVGRQEGHPLRLPVRTAFIWCQHPDASCSLTTFRRPIATHSVVSLCLEHSDESSISRKN